MRPLAAAAAFLAAGAIAMAAGPKRITPERVGQVRIGMTYKEAREKGLIGRMRDGCPLASPPRKTARLRAPLEGSVDFSDRTPRRVAIISVRGGARARGAGIGSTIRQIKAAFPKARVDHGPEETFEITLVKVPKDGGGRIQFAVSIETKKTVLVGVPYVQFCE
jgi:hypothetical protein